MSNAPQGNDKNELVLPPSQYAYMQDVTKGLIKTYTGPTVINRSQQETPVVYVHGEGFKRVATLEQAVKDFAMAPQGYYLALYNPAPDPTQRPGAGQAQMSPDISVGRRVNIPGPTHFALWPGQKFDLIRGHELRSNQYLLCRVYDADEAKKNWSNAIMKAAEGADRKINNIDPNMLTPGMLLIIQGTEVSFYIPPTGITVIAEGPAQDGKQLYVRDALTLERLEYCVLVDESGKKRFEHGPQVVFPRPSEKFLHDKTQSRKFAAIELNEIQGIHIKVIQGYTDETTKKEHKQGDEIFLTGAHTPIYFPREEHSIVTYDGKTKHFATAVPAGEARYVMNRKTGEITKAIGAAMLLPNPVDEVIIRRALSDQQCALWYPGNHEVQQYNAMLREIGKAAPTTRAGAVSEGDLMRGAKGARGREKGLATLGGDMLGGTVAYAASNTAMLDHSNVNSDQMFVGDEISRSSTYTQPRSVTLNTKLQGVPSINVWPGYAISVWSKTNRRKVVQGPQTVLLDYDEDLEILELSMGKPKTTDQLLRTVFLQTMGNRVSDFIEVETRDKVVYKLYLSYNVDFTGDPEKWFSVSNYVKMLCDRARSMLKSHVRKLSVSEFDLDSTQIIRDLILGPKKEGAERAGLMFAQNGMHVRDLDVLSVVIQDPRIKQLLDVAQHDAVRGTLALTAKERELKIVSETARYDGEIAMVYHNATTEAAKLKMELITQELALDLLKIDNDLKAAQARQLTLEAEIKIADAEAQGKRDRASLDRQAVLQLQHRELEIEKDRIMAETKSVVERMKSVEGSIATTVATLHDKEIAQKMAEAFNVQAILGGKSLTDTVAKIFKDTPLAAIINRFATGGNGTAPSPRAS